MSDDLRDKIIGLGESSFKKSYYPELQKRNKEFELFKLVFEKANDLIAIINIYNLEFKYVNKAFCDFFHIDENKYHTYKPIDILGETYCNRIKKFDQNNTKHLQEVQIGTKTCFVEAEISLIEQERERLLINILRDMTDYLKVQRNLEELNKQIVVQNNELHKRNKQIAQINIDLLAAKEKAEESDRLKTAFLQNMSHEIRTPMNGIFGFAELIRQPGILKEDMKNFGNTIFSAAKQLLSVVDDIINISTITTGQEKVNYSRVDLHQLFEEVILLFTNIADQKEINIVAPEFIPKEPLWTDEVKLKQILTNLIGNAIKFSEKGSIILSVQEDGDYLTFSVMDQGTGIPDDMKEVIFERFRQVDDKGSRKMGGTGLGLAICKGYVELLKGEIKVESHLNKGSTFSFTHPIKQ